ncbi:MAG: BspA family leucine-rich repeat surface protein [Lentilactobacillus diolivorans]|nr:BspA family leucine-rich repeat surface protein [Lentilactobacillus diolivorans]
MIGKKCLLSGAVVSLSLSAGLCFFSVNTKAITISKSQAIETTKNVNMGSQSGTWGGSCPWKVDGQTLIIGEKGHNYKITEGTNGISPFSGIKNLIFDVASVDIEGNITLPKDSSYLFYNLQSVTSISGLNNLDTSQVTNMSYMFYDDHALKSLDCSNWDTSNVTSMHYMFADDNSATSVACSKWDTSRVVDMSMMFVDDSELMDVDVSNWNMAKVYSIGNMFGRDSNIQHIDVSKWNTSNVVDMTQTFLLDRKLEGLDVSKWNTSKVESTMDLFCADRSLTKLDVSNWDTSSLTSMDEMFGGTAITSLDLSNWDTSKNTDWDVNVFEGDQKLWKLKLGNKVNGLVLSSFPEHSEGEMVPNTNKKTSGPGWQAVGNGTDTDPQGQTYSYENFIKNPLYGTTNSPETYVWQQEPAVDQYTLDVNKNQDLYQGQTWDPTSAITSATKNGTDDKSDVTITDKDGNPVTQSSISKLAPGTYDLTYKNGDKTSTLTLTIKPDLASLKTTNIDLYLNKSFKDADLRENIDSKDSDGNPLNYRYSIKDASGTVPVDQVSSKKGQYTVEITTDKPKDGKAALKGTLTINVTDKSTLSLKYNTDTITVGQAWKPEDAFKNATDTKGNNLAFKDVKVTATYGNNKPVKDLSNLNTTAGTYTVHYINGSAEKDLKLIVQTPSTPSTPTTPTTPTTPVTPSTPTTSSSSSSSSSTSSTSSSTPTSSSSSSSSSNTSLPSYAAAKGTVVYSINKIGLYKSTNFSATNRSAWYMKKPRVYRPMFVVTGYARSANGILRYQVRDVNHLSKTDGQKGYITASRKYVRPVYYATEHSTVTVINPRGVNAYRKANLVKKARSYRQGTVLHVKRIVTHNLTARYVLTNGDYITANRKLVNMGRHKQVKSVKTKRALNRYNNANFTKKNHTIAKNRALKVYGYDYSQKNSVTKHGALRYRVAGGYITANTKYVRAYK